MRRGAVVSLEDAGRALALLRSELERQLGAAVTHATVGIGGPNVRSILSHGLVVVSRPDNRIGAEDIRRVLEAAGAISLHQNLDVLVVMPREFIVDGERGMKDVEGMEGRRLEVEAVVLTAGSQHVKNLEKLLGEADLEDHEFIVSPVATARAVLSPRQRELGVALVDIGHGTTEIAVYEDGQLLAVAMVPIGGAHITNDIAIGLRCSIDAAERAKHDYGIANAENVPKRETFELRTIDPTEDGATFSRRELAEIIDARLDEIFELVGEELKRIDRWRLLPAGIVLTGGTAAIPGITDAARKAFRLPVQLGYPNAVGGPSDVLSGFNYATAIGLVLSAADLAGERKRKRRGLPSFGPANHLKRFFRSLLP
jgi:cell division protein FtsA